MLTQEDLQQIAKKGISIENFNRQLESFRQGFPYLKLQGAATPESGILQLNDEECRKYTDAWERYKEEGKRIVKFVPASGAASRMFKDLFAFLDADYTSPSTEFEKYFFSHIDGFAFKAELDEVCIENEGKNVAALIREGNCKAVVSNLLNAKGLNYGQLPKGLLTFHDYDEGSRSSMEEHLVEAALYAESNGEANVHFTVSNEHLDLFKKMVAARVSKYEELFNVKYNISFSEQKSSTDTIGGNSDNTPFRNEDGSLLFRPGGHGALIENLNDINADVVYIKNIDNVVPDRLKEETVKWKKIIAGLLVALQAKAFSYIERLETEKLSLAELKAILAFLENDLYCKNPDADALDEEQLREYLLKKLNRPMRVCGMVKNSGEPGGGPFFAYNADGTVSLQILESSQIDKNNPEYLAMFRNGTHFNPVDLVCALKDCEGRPFNLPGFVDPATGFISSKSKNGKELKALELPGLWNGAMSDWNTVFVEVPAITFNPVKTVNDLLRSEHTK